MCMYAHVYILHIFVYFPSTISFFLNDILCIYLRERALAGAGEGQKEKEKHTSTKQEAWPDTGWIPAPRTQDLISGPREGRCLTD